MSYPTTESPFNALSETSDIVSYAQLVNSVAGNDGAATGAKALRPELFYTKQLLETIRLGADQYSYYRIAETSPIPDKSMKLQLRRWAPLQAHTSPLQEGIPPQSDKGSVETYEIDTAAYGRFMEFTDRVDLDVVDPVIATYTKEYSIVAIETLDMLARDALLTVANPFLANQAANFEGLSLAVDGTSGEALHKPSIADLRLIVLQLKKNLVRPRMNGKFQVICSPEFVYDMITDPYVEKFMRYNNSTKTMYENGTLVPMFDMEFYENMATPNSGEFTSGDVKALRLYRLNPVTDAYEYKTILETDKLSDNTTLVYGTSSGYVQDGRTHMDASYIPNRGVWNLASFNADTNTAETTTATAEKGSAITIHNGETYNAETKLAEVAEWKELMVNHCIIVGKDALIRTGMSGQDNAQMYVKAKGSTGVLDPIDQRQSIGFKINSVGFGSARTEAVYDYMSIPTTLNV